MDGRKLAFFYQPAGGVAFVQKYIEVHRWLLLFHLIKAARFCILERNLKIMYTRRRRKRLRRHQISDYKPALEKVTPSTCPTIPS